MTQVVFEQVSAVGHWRGRCSRCGKKRSRTVRFVNTVNPFNQNAAGLPKTREEVWQDVSDQRRAWQERPRVCLGCESMGEVGDDDE